MEDDPPPYKWAVVGLAALAAVLVALASPTTVQAHPLPAPDPPPPWDMPMVVTWYDPSQGGINCDEGGGCDTYGSGQPVRKSHYGRSAACIVDWRGKWVAIQGVGVFVCRDSGGAIRMTYHREYGMVMRVDILSKDPWHPGPYEDWWLCDELCSYLKDPRVDKKLARHWRRKILFQP